MRKGLIILAHAIFTGVIILLPCPAFGQSTTLNFRPVAAEFSTPLNRIIMISASPNQLHIYGPAGPSDVTVNLSKPPLSLAVSPDGLHAAIGHDSLISYVNLTAAVVEKTFPISVSAQTITLSATWIYVMPSYQGDSVSVEIPTGAVTPNRTVFYASGGKVNPAVNALYSSQDGLSPNKVSRFDISTGPITKQIYAPYHGDYPTCGPLFFSTDGSRIYTGCNAVFRASTDPALDMRYLTSFPGGLNARSITESALLKRVAAVTGPRYTGDTVTNDNIVYLYEYEHLNPAGQFTLTDLQGPGSRTIKVHAKWVFFDAASTALYVVVQADLSSGLLNDFSVQTISLAPAVACGASFNVSSAEAVADGEIATAGISAASSCRYEAVSTSSWIQIISGGYGSGNGTLTYIVRANSQDQRTGTISLPGSTLTVTQAGVSPPGPLTRLPYNVVAATYNKAINKLILISANPNELHIYDLSTRSEQTVQLVMAPLCLSVSPDGNFAAVGYDGWVSYVDLQSMSIVETVQVITDVNSVLLAGNGYIYLFPKRDWSDIYSLEISTSILTATGAIYQGRIPRLSSDGQSMYLGGSWFSKWSISSGVAKPVTGISPTVNSCGNLWLSEDGRRLFTACGRVYRTSTVPSEDMQPNGALSPNNSVRWVDESLIQQSTAIIAGSPNSQEQGSTQIYLYGDAFLDYRGMLDLPSFNISGKSYSGFGQYVFWNKDASALTVIEKVDTAANAASSYGVASISPTLEAQTPFTIFGRGGASWTSLGAGAFTSVGFARVKTLSGSGTPSGLAIFGARQNGVLVSEATVPAVTPVQSGRIYAEIGDSVDTGLAIANPSPTAAKVTFYFTDQSGANSASASTMIPANGQIAAFLDQAPFNGLSSFMGTFTFSSDTPIAAVALRGHSNERSELLWTTLPVLPLNYFFGPQIFPTAIDGGGWTTQFVLVNTTDSVLNGTLQFFPQGPPGPLGSSLNYSIPARSSRKLMTTGSGTTLLARAVRIVPDSRSFSAPLGIAIFSETNAEGVTISEAGVPASSNIQQAVLYAQVSDDASLMQTGVAIASTSSTPTNVTLELTTLGGGPPVLTGNVTVPANGQIQMYLNQIRGFENLKSFQGLLTISAKESAVSVVGLRSRYNERGDYLVTTIPVASAASYSFGNSTALFPVFADGNGYTTQFILFDTSTVTTGPSSVGNLLFFTPAGQRLNLDVR